jgi:hypothetical protein
MATPRPAGRAFWITFLDAALIVAAGAAAVIILGGRTRFDVAGISVTLRSATNLAVFIGAAGLLRLGLGRRLRLLPALPLPDSARIEAERDRFVRPPARPPGFARYATATALASILWLTPHLAHPRQVPDPGDPAFSAWRLARFAHQLVNDPRHLFDGNIFYPASHTLTFSDATVLQGLAAAPFLLAGVDPLIVANMLFFVAFPLRALAFFYAGWRLTGDLRAAFITGVLGALSPFYSQHYSHLELQYTLFIPLAVVALLELLACPSAARGVRLGILIAAQWLASMYLGLMLLTFLIPFGLMVAAAWRPRPLPAALRAFAIAGTIVILGFASLAVPYLSGRAGRGERSMEVVRHFSAQPAEYGRTHGRLASHQWISRRGNREERELFPGLATPVLAAAGAVPPLGATAIASLVAGALAFEWSLGTNGLTYDDLYRRLLPYRGVRVPARFGVFATIALVLLAAFGTRRLLAAAARARLDTPVFVALGALTLVDLRLELRLREYWRDPPGVYGAVTPSMVLAEFPIGENHDNDIAYMYFSTRHWARLLNGYSGSFPEAFVDLQKELAPFPAPAAVDAARRAGATHLTFNCALEPRIWRCARTIEFLEANPQLEPVASARWQNAPVKLYRFR